MKTLLIGEIEKEAQKLLKQHTELIAVSSLKQEYHEVEAVILRTYTKLGKEELALLPNLKCVVSCSVGIDNLNLSELKNRNIELIHCPGSNANSVAEHALYLILALLRNNKPIKELKNKTVGIIGLGAIGKLVAEKLQGFDVKIIAFDVIEQDSKFLQRLNVKMQPMSTVLQNSDIITVHVPLNPHTHSLMGKEQFKLMNENVFFINTSRAEIVDESALMEKRLAGIALDVFSEKMREHLKGNVILTEHVAAQGEDSFKKMCMDPVKKFLEKIK